MAFWHNSELPRCKGRIDSIALTLYAPALCIYVNAYSPIPRQCNTYTRTVSLGPDSPLAARSTTNPRPGPRSLVCNRPMASSCTNYTARGRRYIIRVHIAIRTSTRVCFSLSLSLVSALSVYTRSARVCGICVNVHVDARKARIIVRAYVRRGQTQQHRTKERADNDEFDR